MRGGRGAGATTTIGVNAGQNWLQQVLNPTMSVGGLQNLGGTGLSTTAITGGLLQIASLTAAYYVRPTMIQGPLDAGSYTVAYSLATYVAGTIGVAYGPNTDLTVSVTAGPGRTANGSYSETVILTTPGYIGLAGQGAAVVNSLQVTSLTIVRFN